jgi:probable phosphoglycerate mutase
VTRLLLLRHAAHDLAGRALAGRLPGLALNTRGREQAAALGPALRDRGIAAIYSSPQLRTRQTAEPVGRELKVLVAIDPDFDEVDFGEWTGKSLEEVRNAGAPWREWVERRSRATPPGGEPFAQVQQRACAGAERLRLRHPEATVLVVSHADVIKAVLATHLRVGLDDLERFEIGCASLSVLDLGEGWSQVKLVNGTLVP